jgi:hypothetical protein
VNRIILCAALLDRKYSNPQVAALNRSRSARTPNLAFFWRSVATTLSRPYKCQSWLQDEMASWDAIRRIQANLPKETA